MNSTESTSSEALPPIPSFRKSKPGPPVHLRRLLLGVVLTVFAFDLCFWNIDDTPGFSLAVFVLLLAGIILVNRVSPFKWRTTGFLPVLLAGAAVATSIETGVTNTFVLMFLIVALSGDSFFSDVESMWGRWLSQIVALVAAPGRVFWLGARVADAVAARPGGWMSGLIGKCLLALPALFLALIFGSLLASGNAVFGSWTEKFFDWFWKELALYLDPGRLILWCVVAVAALPFLRPTQVATWWWKWTENVPRFPEVLTTSGALFSSGLVLVVLNFLFLAANVSDAWFLWSHDRMPPGVNAKVYVHEGVAALICTVLLSAIVLTAIFQQALPVVKRPALRILAYVWIAQNFFLMASIFKKLHIYIIDFQMTVARLSTIIFLILVGAGFILLTIKIARDRSISWLVGGCILAVFATFYITQFLNLGGWAANYNAARMVGRPWVRYDAATMGQSGAEAWPALRRANALTPDDGVVSAAWQRVSASPEYKFRSGLDWKHWREFSLRAYWSREEMKDLGK